MKIRESQNYGITDNVLNKLVSNVTFAKLLNCMHIQKITFAQWLLFQQCINKK